MCTFEVDVRSGHHNSLRKVFMWETIVEIERNFIYHMTLFADKIQVCNWNHEPILTFHPTLRRTANQDVFLLGSLQEWRRLVFEEQVHIMEVSWPFSPNISCCLNAFGIRQDFWNADEIASLLIIMIMLIMISVYFPSRMRIELYKTNYSE